MDDTTRLHLTNIRAKDKELQNAAFTYLMEVTAVPVVWAYEAWDELVADLSDNDNRARAIASQVFCNLAKSDPDKRMLTDFSRLLAVTKDERFVTARHCLQSLWKVGAVGPEQQQVVITGLESRYKECLTEKNGSLTRYDIIQSLADLYDAVKDETIKEKALALIETEEDPKYHKKYATVWKKR